MTVYSLSVCPWLDWQSQAARNFELFGWRLCHVKDDRQIIHWKVEWTLEGTERPIWFAKIWVWKKTKAGWTRTRICWTRTWQNISLRVRIHLLLQCLRNTLQIFARFEERRGLSHGFTEAQEQLNSLMAQLYATRPNLVRCFIPNEEKYLWE